MKKQEGQEYVNFVLAVMLIFPATFRQVTCRAKWTEDVEEDEYEEETDEALSLSLFCVI